MKGSTCKTVLRRGMLMGLSVVFSVFMPFSTVNVWAEEASGIVFEEEAPKPVGGDASYKIEYYKENIEVPAPIPGGRKYQDYGWSDKDSVFVKGASTAGYNTLSEDQKKLYRAIDEKALSFMESTSDYQAGTGESFLFDQVDITILGHEFDSSEIEAVYSCYDYDHPAYYWLYSGYRYSDQYLYLYSYNEFRTASVRATDNELINNGIKEYASMAADGADTLDKIAIVHNLLVTDVNYAYKSDGKTPVDEKWAHSPLGVFDTHKKVVCEGYADTFSLVMNYMSIPNYVIVGKAGSDGVASGDFHRWNAVSDDGGKTFMYMDVTWDDLGNDGYFYNYFGAPRSDFEKEHFKGNTNGDNGRWLYDIDTSNFANSFDKTYYYKGGFYYESGDISEYADLVKTKSFRFGDKVITLAPRNSLAIDEIDAAIPGSGNYNYKATILNTEYHLQIHNGTTDTYNISKGTIKLPTRYYEYTGSDIKPEPVVYMNGVSILKGRNYTVSYTYNKEIGYDAMVKVTGKDKFPGTGKLRFAITDPHKIDPVLTAPTGKEGLVYTGQALDLINEGRVNGGTLCYAAVEKGQEEPPDSAYDTSVPKKTNAGTYTVYYKVLEDNNFYGLLPESLDVTIEGANISYSASGYADEYDGQSHTINVTVRTPNTGYTVKYGLTADNCTLDTPPAETNAGEKTIYFKITADNYKDVISSRKIQIEKRGIAASNIKAKNKTYDGNRDAELDYSGMKLEGKLDADTLSVEAKGTFDSAKVGEGKKVVLSDYVLTGSAKDNYQLSAGAQQAESKANILARPVTVTGITAKYKTYDGKKTATLDLSAVRLRGKLTNDRLGIEVTGTFADADVGTDKIVTLSNMKLIGEDSGNYVLSETGNQDKTYATIGKANVPGSPVIVNINYICSRENNDSISLSGLPSDCGTVFWEGPDKTGNLTFTEEPAISNGRVLTYALATSTEPKEGSVRVTARMKNYKDVEYCFNISLIKQTPTVLKEGSEVSLQKRTLAYGQKLSELRFNNTVFVTDDEQRTVVPGTLSWKTPRIAPEPGTLSAVWVFSPTSVKYIPCEGIATITVSKAMIHPTVSITDWTSGETPATPTVSGNTGGGEVTYLYAERGSNEFIPDVPGKAGYYTVKAVIAETDYYQAGEATADFTVKDPGTGEDPGSSTEPEEIPVNSISLKKTSVTLNMAKKTYADLGAPIFNPENATNKTVTWYSSNNKIVRVTDTGRVYGKKNGNAKITAMTANGKTAVCTVKVRNYVAVKRVGLNRTSVTLDLSKKNMKSVSLKATVSPSKASYKTVTWKISNENVAKVTAKGNKATVRGLHKGTATITATCDGKKSTCKIRVKEPVKVKGVSLNKTTASVKVNKSITLKATLDPADATNKKVTWKSSNKKIAYVTSTGKVTGKKKGTAVITVTTKDGGYKASCRITVK